MNKLRYSAIGCALPVLVYVLVTITSDLQNPLFAKGKIQSGHAELACGDCHVKNPGSYRQQIQANVRFSLKHIAARRHVLHPSAKAIAIATLKKLEKDLIDYDLSNELTIVYKSLKKLHVNSPDYFHYSQLYNRHVAYMLALDKAEDLLAD